MSTIEEVKKLLDSTLQLNGRAADLTSQSPLLNAIPELDSMAVATLITSVEEHYGFTVEDDEIDAEVFATLGTFCAFVDYKLRT